MDVRIKDAVNFVDVVRDVNISDTGMFSFNVE